jgi:hypothetical protein
MNSHHHTSDHQPRHGEADNEALLQLLGQALRTADPVPDHVTAAARGAVAWRTIDQDLADLVFDSSSELTGVRDANAARQLTFRSDGVEIEVMLVDSAQRRLVGQLVPARETTVTLQGTDAEVEQTSDRFGRFTFDRVQTGPVRLSVAATATARGVATDWILL